MVRSEGLAVMRREIGSRMGRASRAGWPSIAFAAALPLLVAGCPTVEVQNSPAARVITSQGEFSILLRTDVSPASTTIFANLVGQGYYNTTVVHRVVADSRIELGGFVRGALLEKTPGDAIPGEAPNGLTNIRGTIAMALQGEPDSARSQFFVNLRDNAEFDSIDGSLGYTVFGRIVEGLDIADQIGAVATTSQSGLDDVPVRDIIIRSAARTQLTGDNAALTGVELETTFGRIVLGLDAAAAPLATANFLGYVDDGFYVNTLFHRAVAGALIQGGGYTRALTPKPVTAAVANESLNGLKNQRGAVAFAFATDFTASASVFIVNVGDNPQFDSSGSELGYAVFGEIIDGIEVVDQIASVVTAARGSLPDVPALDITIERIELYEVPTSLVPAQGNYGSAISSTVRDLLRLLIQYGVSSLG